MIDQRSVVVIGAGIAGTAAALAAARAGARVTMIDGGTGSSVLATGAIDLVGWERGPTPPSPVSSAARAALDALGGYALPDRGARLATIAGLVRTARGHDAALLDIEPLAREHIGVVVCRRPGWDAAAFARAWGEAYAPIDAMIVRHTDEPWLPDSDFAIRHDDAARLTWLADRLRDSLTRAGERFGALLLPPCLGVDRARAETLSKLVGLPCGEAMALPGGPAGLRFERARDRAGAAAGIARRRGRASAITREGEGWQVALEEGADAARSTLEGHAVVLAMGGLVGGGLEYAPPESMVASALPPFARHPFRLGMAAPVLLGARGRPLDLPSTLFGAAPESMVWPFVRDALMDRVGVLADADGRAGPGLFAAGELLADRPRTWLDGLATGARAGAAAALSAVTGAVAPSPGAASPSRP